INTLAVGTGSTQLMENYSYDPYSGQLSSQTVQRAGSTLMSLSYFYQESFECDCDPEKNPQPQALSSARTGQVRRIVNNITGKRQDISYDSLGRLKNITQGVLIGPYQFQTDWTQSYTYDRYGNRMGVTALGSNGS